MKLMPFQAPTDYYCRAVDPIDEQICELIARRKEVSEDNPGFPPLDVIAVWCKKYSLNEDLIRMIFASLYHEDHFRSRVEPKGLIKFVPILKSVSKDGIVYSVTYMKQYQNASVVFVEAEVNMEESNMRFGHTMELSISPNYECRPASGHSSPNSIQHSFIITPPLPDDVSELEFTLTIKPLREPSEINRVVLPEQSVRI